MRLLRYQDDSRLTITSFDDDDNAIPPYAILSHTWGEDAEEVTFADLAKEDYQTKQGYEKIHFCGKQAQQDNMQYFWIDTCCIDRSDEAELSLAIQSMFRWYQNATKCYVYLSDVSARKMKVDDVLNQCAWESAFRSSRWFTRGWTLQELLAPSIVEFFSQKWEMLGDRRSLTPLICKITGIPHQVLQGTLYQFDIEDRLRWKGNRKTKLEEDMAYSLSGICDVNIVPVYGEGKEEAFRRLHHEIQKLKDCLRDLRSGDPRDDKKRIEDTKGGLLADSYRWVLDNSTFQQWQQDPHSQLLWVKGEPGKGKTMLLCGLINELQSLILMPNIELLSYFFCQATESRLNNTTGVLRGLVYMLVDQQPSLMLHIRRKYDRAGKALFEDTNACAALSEILISMIQDKSRLKKTYLVIDALDECVVDLPKLLDLIIRTSKSSPHIKWLISSRNERYIEEKLKSISNEARLSLELRQNAEHIAQAVDAYIDYKLSYLESLIEAEDLRKQVRDELHQKADGTFLWVSLIMQELEKPDSWDPLAVVKEAPAGLQQLYDRMMKKIRQLSARNLDICQFLLCVTAIAYRPLSLAEIGSLCRATGRSILVLAAETVRKIVAMCGSFLTVRNEQVYLIHQSAKDYLSDKMRATDLLSLSPGETHYALFMWSLELLSSNIKRDMYDLVEPGISINEVKVPEPDPLATVRYSCIYWVDHLYESKGRLLGSKDDGLQAGDAIYEFLEKKYLYWLEGLSLCKSVGKGVVSLGKLWSLVQEMSGHDRLARLTQDARRFIMYHKVVIEDYPLQIYASALLFSPTSSLIRQLFEHEKPKQITVRPALSASWSACLQTLEGHSTEVVSVSLSHDSTRLASGSLCGTVKIWDTNNGACLQTLEGHTDSVLSVAFLHDSTRLVSASSFNVKVWDASSGACLQTVYHGDCILSIVFSYNFDKMAIATADRPFQIWHNVMSSSACRQTIEGYSGYVRLLAFSHDSAWIASDSMDKTIKIWDVSSGACLQTLEGHSSLVTSVTFSHNSTRLASGSYDLTVKVWDLSSGACLQTLDSYSSYRVASVSFSHNLTRLASASEDKITIWDLSTGACLQTLEDYTVRINSVAFSHDFTRLVSGSSDGTIKIWDISNGTCLQTTKANSDQVTSGAFSGSSAQLALPVSSNGTAKFWDASSAYLQTLVGYNSSAKSVTFSHDSAWIASGAIDRTIKIWDVSSGACLQTLEGHSSLVTSVTFSHNSTRLASVSKDKIKIWDLSSGACLQTLEGHSGWVASVTFSHDSTRLASASQDEIEIWDLSSGACLQTLEGAEDSNASAMVESQRPLYVATSLSTGMWIRNADKDVLWIPAEYRPYCSFVSGTNIALRVRSGKVWWCSINES